MASKKQMKILRLAYRCEVSHSDILKKLHMQENQIYSLYEIMSDGDFENRYLNFRVGEDGNPLFICNEAGKEIVESSIKALLKSVVSFFAGVLSTLVAQYLWMKISGLLK